MKWTVLLVSCVVLLSCSSGAPDKTTTQVDQALSGALPAVSTINETEIGLAAGTAFEQPDQKIIAFNQVDPGESELRTPPNAEFPPVIPHSVEDMGAITIDENPCLDCHNTDVAEDMGAVAVPASHRMDLRNSPGKTGKKVTGARFVCTSCHVEQTGSEPLVEMIKTSS